MLLYAQNQCVLHSGHYEGVVLSLLKLYTLYKMSCTYT